MSTLAYVEYTLNAGCFLYCAEHYVCFSIHTITHISSYLIFIGAYPQTENKNMWNIKGRDVTS